MTSFALFAAAAACGGGTSEPEPPAPSRSAEAPVTGPSGSETVTEAALALIPEGYSVDAESEELCSELLGGALQCVNVGFTANDTREERSARVARVAEERGWRLVDQETDGGVPVVLRFERGDMVAQVMLAESTSPPIGKDDGASFNLVSVAQTTTSEEPVAPLPGPETPERRKFVAAANAACAPFAARLDDADFGTDPDAWFKTIVDEWHAAVERIAALEPPRQDEDAVQEFLHEARRLEDVMRAIQAYDPEQGRSRPSFADLVAQGDRVDRAGRRLGLRACVGAVPGAND